MKPILLVLRQEITSTLARRSFQLTAFGLPLLSLLALGIYTLVSRGAPGGFEAILGPASSTQGLAEGYVDQSGLLQSLPAWIPEGALQPFADEATALQALEAGQIAAFYLIPPDYLELGQVVYVRPDFNPLAAFGQGARLEGVLHYNLLEGDARLAALVQDPLDLQVTILQPSPARDQDHPMAFFLPYSVTLLVYIAVLMSSGLLLSSLNREKQNRVLEILLVSLSPRQLLTGKLAGLGLIGLLQTGLWLGMGYLLLRLGGRTLALPPEFQLPLSFLAWAGLFFLLGYALYGGLMAGLGALVSDLREASQFTVVLALPLLAPLMFISLIAREPHGALATALSLFPFSAPVAMMARLASAEVPLWQLLASAGLLAGTSGLVLLAAAGLFRTQTLLVGQPLSLRRVWRELRSG
ncbi:MAG TPA: ABC transporter permease [Anaerolineales bacterium]|nr:ABC transporter permease [Anaerolineales bacterium]